MWALTIAGGKGERLRPLTDRVCKPMVEVAGLPLLARQVEWLRQNGVQDVVFLTGYRGEQVSDYFGDGSGHGIRAHYSQEDTPLGRGGCVKLGMGLLPPGVCEFVVVNGDILTDQSLDPLLALRREHDATVAVMLTPYISEYGVVTTTDSGRVTEFSEKCQLPYWVNGGVYVFHRRIRNELPDVGDHETETLPGLVASGEVMALQSEAGWVSLDSLKDLRAAEAMVGELA